MEFKIINKFKNNEKEQRKILIEKMIRIICKIESNEEIKYIKKIKVYERVY